MKPQMNDRVPYVLTLERKVKRCKCGYRIRGANHENGEHHKKGRKR